MKTKFLSRIGMWNTPPCIRKFLTSLKALTLLLVMLMSVNVWGAEKTLIIDGSKLTSTATTAATDYTYGDFTITMSDGAKSQSSSGDNKFANNAILIGKSGKYIYNKTPFGKKITKFELYANKGASTKVSVGVLFSTTAISAYATGTNTYTATLSTVDKVYDCSSKIPEGAKYFWYQVTNANNSQVMFRVTYEEEEEDPTEPSLSVSPTTIDFGTVEQNAAIPAGQDVEVTFENLTTNDVTASISGDFNINKTGSFTSGDKITVTPKSTATIGTIEGTLTVKATTDDITKTVPVTMTVAAPEVGVSFEKTTSAYTDWTFTNFESQQTHSEVTAHTGAYFGTTGGKEKCSMVTKAKIAKPGTLQFFISKQTTNTTSSNWKVSVSSDNSNWTPVNTTSATGMTKGNWQEVSVDLTAYSNVYVKIEYDGSTAYRCIDDVVFIAPQSYDVTLATSPTSVGIVTAKVNNVEIGAQVEEGQTVTLSAVPNDAHAYRFKEWQSDDVTITDNAFDMPGKAVSITAVFEPLYAVSLTTAGEGSGTATINGGTSTIYVSEDDIITLVAEVAAGSEFGGWTASNENIIFDNASSASTTALAGAAGTITATFGVSALLPLDAPTLSDPTNITYNSVTLNWQELANAEGGYYVEIWLDDVRVVFESGIGETSWTPDFTFQANTTYTYTVQGVGDGTIYAEENNPKATSTFTTADYPAATLTLSENGVTRTLNGKLNTPIELPTTSTQACDGKVFMGWSENAIDGEVAKEQVTLLGATYTFDNPSVLTKTIYAVYAKAISGESQKYTLDYTTDVSSKTLGYGSAVEVTASDGSKWVVKASKQQGMQINTGKNASIKIPTCPRNITSIEVVGTAAKAVGLSAEDYSGSGTITYIAFGTDAKEQTIDLTNKSVTSGYIVGKSGANPITKIVVNYEGESSYSNYCTTCQAAVAAPTFSLEGGNYSEAKTLILTATEGAIYYTINGGTETLYEEEIVLDNRGTYEISAYAKVDDRTSETVTKTYTLDWAYTLAELVAEGTPTTTGRTVTVILTNEIIESFATSGSYVNGFFTMVGDKKIEVYCKNSPSEWEVGGKVSGTVTCPWKLYSSTWELCPENWNWVTNYTAPAKITSLKITGDVTNKNYTAGQKLDFTGLTVTGVYSDAIEEDVTADVVWTEVTLTENQPEATATATLNNAKTGNVAVNASKTITGLTVGAAKTLESIFVADDSEHKKTFFVGRPFSAEGLKVMARYNMGDDQQIAVANLDITNTTFSEAKAEHAINISYTENGVEKTTSYNVEVTYMNLNNLVTATDINDHDHVYVKFENVMITKLVSKGILLNVQKGDKDIEIYNQSANYPNTWEQYGTVSATLDNVEWTNYQGTWEFKISNWDVVEYTAPNIPVTSMEISPAEVSVGEAKTTTLSIVYTPEHATNTGVTWAVAEGSEYASVDEEGVVTGRAVGTATITATLTADPTITATRTVTVTETAKCEISYYVKGELASTQQIVREEEGTLTYVPELEVAGYTFAGWAEAAIAEETATATLITKYTPGAEEETKSVYAVFKRVDDSSPTYQKYAKVTSALTDWAGDYLIAYSDEIFANGQKGGTDDGAIGKQYVNVKPEGALSGNVVTKEWGDQYKVTLEEISTGSNTYVLKTQDGKYNYQTGNSNGLTTSSTKSTAAQYPISVTFTSENDVKLALGGGATGAVFRYNTDQYFRYYKDGGQKAIYLYKYDEGSALYTSNPVAKVKVTFNLDGGVGGCGTITVNEGGDAVLCGDAPTKDLYKFDAWSDGMNEYAPSATIENVTEDIELTALWIAKQQYTISFNKGGAAGTTPDAITDYEYNEVTLPAQGDLSNPGYVFSGWNDGETTYAGGATFTMPEKNVSMTAVWVLKTNDKWVLVTDASQLVAGSKYVIANNENDAVAGDITGSNVYMNKVDATFSDNKQFITGMTGQVELTLGGSTNAWTFAKDASNYLANSGTDLSWSTTASTWKIAFENDEMTIVEGTNNSLQYNTGSPRFKTYTSSQAAVQLYRLIPAQAIDEEVNASELDDHADVTVNEGGNLLINAPKTLGDIYVMEGGKVTISGSATLTVSNFVIKSTMGGGQSGQVLGVTSTNFIINGEAYFDVTLGDNANPEKWHAFAVPFNVDAINGIYDLDDNKLTNEVNYAIMDYHGDVRAQGQYGWKKFRGIMNPGTFYLMTVDGERTTYRMKMNGGFQVSSSTISVTSYTGAGADTDAGWNGIANNQLGYSSVGVDVQVLNPISYTYEVKTASECNFTVGTPFFYQANATGTIDLTAPNAGENYAPRRVGAAEIKDVNVMLSNNNYTDHLYLSATDEATNEYQIGRDLVKMTMTSTPAVPQIFAEAYGNKLCMVDAPMVNDEATYALNLYAPAAGEYTIGAAQVEGYEVFLTQGGLAIWNLSMGETAIELKKGNNNGYGIVIKKAHNTTTDVENVFGNGENTQKFIFNDNLYIVRDGKMFDAQGKLVK